MDDKKTEFKLLRGVKKMTETKKVNIELEVDTNVVDSSKNQYQSWIDKTEITLADRTYLP